MLTRVVGDRRLIEPGRPTEERLKMDFDVVVKRFDAPDEARELALGRFEEVHVIELRPGEQIFIPSDPHDSWVVGDEPYVSLHFLWVERYAAKYAQ